MRRRWTIEWAVGSASRLALMVVAVLVATGCSNTSSGDASTPAIASDPEELNVGTTLPIAPSPIPSPPPTPTAGLIAEPELAGATAVLGRSPEGFEYLIAYERADGRGNGEILVRKPGGATIAALLDEDMLLPAVHDMKFGPDGLVGFASDHFNYGPLIFVGRRDDSGRIRDLHRLGDDLHSAPRPFVIDRFEQDGTLIAGEFLLDTTTDPRFVNTAATPPSIEGESLTPSVDDNRGRPGGAWHRGETLNADPACGASTLYRKVPDGWERVLVASMELDTVVAVHVTDLVGLGGVDTVGVGRQVVLATECPSAYEGQRLYWGQDGVDYGDGGPPLVGALRPLLIENLTVDEVVSITPVVGDLWGNVSDLVLEVRTLDGELATVGVSRIGEPNWRAVASVRPALEDGVIEAVPFGRVGEAAWVIQSTTRPDRIIQVNPATGDVSNVIWEEGGDPGVQGEGPLGGQSLRCPGLTADGSFQMIQVFYELGGVLLDEVTVTEIADREIVNEHTSFISGSAVPYDMSFLCERPRLPPRNITALQLENLLDLVGFEEIGFDHPIDPRATASARWEAEPYLFVLDQGPEALDSDDRIAIRCLMGILTIDAALPPAVRAELEAACAR